tara:strand:- start:409 stop:654 length:246 start_codon:yes stop_codon:yes gene_type:complete
MYTPSHVVIEREIKQVCDENLIVVLETCDQIDTVRSRLDTLVQTHGARDDIRKAAALLQDASDSLSALVVRLGQQLRGIVQ